MRTLEITGNKLRLQDVVLVAREKLPVRLGFSARAGMLKSRRAVENLVRQKKKVYGISTGFGRHADIFLDNFRDVQRLQENIVFSHLTGVGDYLDQDAVRATMLIRANNLAKGYSGVRPELVNRLVSLLNNDILPLIPQKGSVGASGDLSPLAYMSLPVMGKGKVLYKNRVIQARAALKQAELSPRLKLSYKEGLALTNGTSVMTAIGVLCHQNAINLAKACDIAGAMSLEAVCGRISPFDKRLHQARPFAGQILSAENIRNLTRGSTLLEKGNQVQDSYSIRCLPQVHGASWDTIGYVGKVLETEINSATDNPLFFSDGKAYSGGNFHGQPIALGMDFLGIALSELGNISERRTQKLLDAHHNAGLPSNLVPRPGLNTGLMIAQYTAAALVSENKILAHPASVDSIPTSANIEDHVSMGTIAARKAKEILRNVEQVTAIELLCATQALDFRLRKLKPRAQDSPDTIIQGKPGVGALAAHQVIRNLVKPLVNDRRLDKDIQIIRELIVSGRLVAAVEKKVGRLYRTA
jgi:histidine ammonia-lyase